MGFCGDLVDGGAVILEKSHSHLPSDMGCGCCVDEGKKRAFRDVVAEFPDGRVVHYFHQLPLVTMDGGVFTLRNHGFKRGSTARRLNDCLPSGFAVECGVLDWFVHTPGGRVLFKDGMKINVDVKKEMINNA